MGNLFLRKYTVTSVNKLPSYGFTKLDNGCKYIFSINDVLTIEKAYYKYENDKLIYEYSISGDKDFLHYYKDTYPKTGFKIDRFKETFYRYLYNNLADLKFLELLLAYNNIYYRDFIKSIDKEEGT
jgi:hypothetical protein